MHTVNAKKSQNVRKWALWNGTTGSMVCSVAKIQYRIEFIFWESTPSKIDKPSIAYSHCFLFVAFVPIDLLSSMHKIQNGSKFDFV